MMLTVEGEEMWANLAGKFVNDSMNDSLMIKAPSRPGDGAMEPFDRRKINEYEIWHDREIE